MKKNNFLKVDKYGNIVDDTFDNILNEAVEGPQLLKDEEEEEGDEKPEDSVEDDDIDIESGHDDLAGLNDEPVTDDHIEPEINTTPQMQVVSLEDVKSLLQSILGNQAPVAPAAPATEVAATTVEAGPDVVSDTVAQDDPAINGQKGLKGGPDALKSVFFQGEGNETLDSEFDFTKDSANALESKVEGEDSYIDSINGLPVAYADFEDVAQKGAAMPKAADNPQVFGGSTTYDDMDGGEFENPDMARQFDMDSDYGLDGMPGSIGSEPETEVDLDLDAEPVATATPGEEDELLLDGQGEPEDELNEAPGEDFDYEEEGHPDLHRIVGPIDPVSDTDDEFEVPEVDDYTPAPVSNEPAPITTNSVAQIGGQQVQIILTGVMITPAEMNYIGESVNKAGNKLKAIKGQENELQIVIESQGKQYTINYIDAPKYKEPTPFSVKQYKFGSLEEALGRINHSNVEKTQHVFKTIISEGIANRSINEYRESDIFEGLFENVKYTGSWTVKTVGSVNLKSGLNETFSNIIQHGTEPNTLVKTTEGDYYMIKGNLKERSKVGTRKELVDIKGKESYGIAEVIGVYENTSKGLGKIMEQLKRTSLPLLVWK